MTAALLCLLLARAASAAPTTAEAGAPSVSPTTAPITAPLVLERFTALDRDLRSLACDFVQVLRWEQSGVSQNVEGSLEYRKPELLRIEQRAPEPQTTVSDGRWLWIYRPSTDQVIQTKLEDWKRSEPLAQSLLDFGNYAELLKRYDVAVATVGASDALGYRAFELLLGPKEKGKSADFSLRLKLSTRDFFPYETELRAGQVQVRSSLKRVRFNPPIADERFRFAPPPGADVFENFKPPRPE